MVPYKLIILYLNMLYIHDEVKTTTLYYENINFFILLGVKTSEVCEGQRHGGKDRLLYWPITSYPLDYTTLCYLQCLTSSSNESTQPVLVRRLLAPLRLRFSISRLDSAASWHWLKTHIVSDPQTGICIYHFITPSISDQPHDCFRLFTLVRLVQRNLWLMTRSRVNMQQIFWFINLSSHQIDRGFCM